MSQVFKSLPRIVAVLGSGQMGSGIAELVARHEIPVVLMDSSQKALDTAMPKIETSMRKAAKRGKMPESEVQPTMDRIRPSVSMNGVRDADLVIEAVQEDESVKRDVFAELDRLAPEHAVLATNTSSISITRIAAATKRPDQVVGLHFMNPAPVMTLIEIVRGMGTSKETLEAAEGFSKHLGKTTVVSADRPGFIVNRILIPMINEAFFVMMEGVASPSDIDTGMVLGTNHPMGPLTLADFIGLDVCLAVTRVLHESLGEDKYRPCPLMVSYVDAGWLGRKTRRGVFKY
ncbi:hypothetical protein BSKO_09611 [Bryopsis sp. KO-2023]|nr:hypothetical protein BSKO_09611 [Bryopsis sp. KO-2023]